METQANVQEKSGSAGARQFPDWDSRAFRYYDPKGRRATHYEDVTVDVQPDPERYLLQNWIISFGDGQGGYEKSWTSLKSADWHKFRAIDQEWERTHYQRQSTIVGMLQNVIDNARRARTPTYFEPSWIKILQSHLGAWKHAEFGMASALMHAQRYGFTQMINNATLTNASYKMRFSQDLTLYLSEIGIDIPDFDQGAGKKTWLEDPIWQPTRRVIESIMGATDYLEQYFAINAVFEPLVGELFRSGFIMQAASANRDFVTPAVVSASEADYERNLANTVDLFHILRHDPEHGDHNKAMLEGWMAKYAVLCAEAANHLQPIWSQPRSKPVQFADSYARAKERLNTIATQIDIDVPQEDLK
jgi:propane monooxygenase small subunit